MKRKLEENAGGPIPVFAALAIGDRMPSLVRFLVFCLVVAALVGAGMFYLANGILSAISDNVFVATVYINEVFRALQAGTIDRNQFDLLAVAINTGTNIPSVATPNGQAAFLFLLTSSLAPIIRLSYGRMVWMALPYTITMTLVGLLAAYVLLEPATSFLYDINLIQHHSITGQETGGPVHH